MVLRVCFYFIRDWIPLELYRCVQSNERCTHGLSHPSHVNCWMLCEYYDDFVLVPGTPSMLVLPVVCRNTCTSYLLKCRAVPDMVCSPTCTWYEYWERATNTCFLNATTLQSSTTCRSTVDNKKIWEITETIRSGI